MKRLPVVDAMTAKVIGSLVLFIDQTSMGFYARAWLESAWAEHPAVAILLDQLAGLYQKRGMYRQAKLLYERALQINEKALGATHLNVATALSRLARFHKAQGAYIKAAPLYERALRICEHALGAEHRNIVAPLNNLALLYQAQGLYAQAKPLYERALCVCEKTLRAEHPDMAAPLNNLASLYQAQGEYAQAEPLYERALRIRETALGVSHPSVATSLNNLALLYQVQGAYRRAKPLYERALCIREQIFGTEHLDVAASLSDLAFFYQAQGEYAQAVPFCERALRIREQVLETEHPDVGRSLNTLAVLYRAQVKYTDAEQHYKRALRILEKTLGLEHPDVATVLNNLAALYQAQGAYGQAEPLYKRALSIREHVLGLEHPDVAVLQHNLAMLSWSTGDASCALQYFVRAVAVRERHLGRTLATLSEPRKRQFLQSQRGNALVSFHAHCAPDDIHALVLTLTTTLRQKGRVLEEVAREHATLRRNLTPALQLDLDALQQRRTELATRRQATYDSHHIDTLHALEYEIERLESELSRKSATFRVHVVPPSIESVQAALPRGATLVEFVHYQRYEPQSLEQEWKESRYIAYVLQYEGLPQWVALGAAEPIKAAVTAALSALCQPGRDARESLRALDELIFAPIRRRLGPTDHFLLSPDDALHLVPFAALIDEHGRYLIESLLITYVTSGRDLVRSRSGETEEARSKPLVVAAPDYRGRLDSLPGTRAEAAALQKHFADIDLYVGSEATKEKLTAAHGPRFVHVATHGFFRAPPASESRPTTRSWRDDRDIFDVPSMLPPADDLPDIEDALDHSGLILAGTDEATLTAREITGIDLRGTQLVVLSACNTGVGEVAQSEGVYGLRRALVVAGAETQVVSLWKVDDYATSQLMDRYYSGLRCREGRSEALRRAQIELLRNGRHAHPFYWAAFVPIGDERPLQLD